MAGRPPKPTALKILEGTDKTNPQRVNHREPKPVVGRPMPSVWLTPGGRRYWAGTLRDLESMKVLTEVDGKAVALLCNALSDYVKAAKEVEGMGLLIKEKHYNKDGDEIGSNWKLNPAATARADSWRRANLMLQQFGLTPASRAKVKTEKPEEVDELEALLRRKA